MEGFWGEDAPEGATYDQRSFCGNESAGKDAMGFSDLPRLLALLDRAAHRRKGKPTAEELAEADAAALEAADMIDALAQGADNSDDDAEVAGAEDYAATRGDADEVQLIQDAAQQQQAVTEETVQGTATAESVDIAGPSTRRHVPATPLTGGDLNAALRTLPARQGAPAQRRVTTTLPTVRVVNAKLKTIKQVRCSSRYVAA